MQILVKGFGTTDAEKAQIWLADGMFRRKVPNSWVYIVDEKGKASTTGPITNAQVHQSGILGNLSWSGNVFGSGGDPNVWGIDVDTLGATVNVSDEQVVEFAHAVYKEIEPQLEDAAFEGAQRAEKE